MSESLQAESVRLDGVIQALINDTKAAADTTAKKIEELNIRLQNIEKTDLRENADYQIAKDELAMRTAIFNLQMKRVDSMSHEMGNYTPTGFITLGSTVELDVIAINGKPPRVDRTHYIVKVVQHDTSTMKLDLMSIDSKVGAAILGRAAGDEVDVEAPGGVITYKIGRIY